VGPPKFNTPFSSISPPGHLGRPNQHPIHDRLGRVSPPIPLLWPKSTSFQKRPNLGRFLEIVPNWDAKTPHGYGISQIISPSTMHQVITGIREQYILQVQMIQSIQNYFECKHQISTCCSVCNILSKLE